MKLLVFDIDVSLSVKYLSVAISSWQMDKELQDCMWETITNLHSYMYKILKVIYENEKNKRP